MKDCDYLQKKQAQQGKGIKYDEVMAMIRVHLIKHGIVMVVRQSEMEMLNGVEGTKQKIYQGRYEMDLVNIDKPEEIVTHTAYAHGMDGGDKAPGKAHTYATKIMLVKGFGIETGEDEESRAEKIEAANTISDNQVGEITKLINGDSRTWHAITKAYAITDLSQIKASKFDEVKTRINNFKAKQNANN